MLFEREGNTPGEYRTISKFDGSERPRVALLSHAMLNGLTHE